MSDWTAGYVADIGYTFGYYTELNPLRVKLAFLDAGLVAPEIGTACELGFGQGMSANLHAAASVVSWHGTDFNPSQAGFAQELAAASGSGAQLHDDAFADFCNRPELPDFDYIGLHGIWSWISDTNRAVIVDFIRRKLKVGGVLYISYNTLPGWSTFAPMRHLLTQHASTLGAEGSGIVNRIEGALGFADKLVATNPLYSRANPSVPERLNTLKSQNRNYLAHEYFNADWHPMYFADMTKWLAPAKVGFACSTHLLDHVAQINFSADQQAILNDITDLEFKETVRDYMVNQQFRKDYWVKGARKLSALEQSEALRQLRVVLTTPRADIPLKVTAALGEANMSESVYGPILDAMADHKIKTVAQLEQLVKDKGVNFAQLNQAIVILAGGGHVQLAQDEQVANKARKTSDKLNACLMNKARGSTDISYLSSPVTGGGITVGRFAQLFLLARSQGAKQPAEWAQFTWNLLAAQGQQIIKEGKQLTTADENLAELNAQAQAFADKQLPILKALMVA
jgi:SAM-dependent methyltransferase